MDVKHTGGWDLAGGSRVDYYEVGEWSMELVGDELDRAIEEAEHAVAAHTAWLDWLKKRAQNT